MTSFSERIPIWPLQPTIIALAIVGLFQWTNSYMATSTAYGGGLYMESCKFQWTNSYMATSTRIRRTCFVWRSFSERIPIWPLQLSICISHIDLRKFQWTNSYMATSTNCRRKTPFRHEWFQWTNSYMATSTSITLETNLATIKFQWTNSYMATSTEERNKWNFN